MPVFVGWLQDSVIIAFQIITIWHQCVYVSAITIVLVSLVGLPTIAFWQEIIELLPVRSWRRPGRRQRFIRFWRRCGSGHEIRAIVKPGRNSHWGCQDEVVSRLFPFVTG